MLCSRSFAAAENIRYLVRIVVISIRHFTKTFRGGYKSVIKSGRAHAEEMRRVIALDI